MRIGVIGINHKHADLKLRECFAKICQHRFTSEKFAHPNHSFVLLTTCNRTEVYFASDDLAKSHSYIINVLRRDFHDIEENYDQKLYSYFGHDCFKHLARVTAGLDSAIVAETEIQGQVKAAYEHSMQELDLPGEVHYLFQKALKIGKEIRSKLLFDRGIPNLEHAILTAGYQTFGEPEKSRVLFVGASEINRKILAYLQTRCFQNITVCNRTLERAAEIAKKYETGLLDWKHLPMWMDFDMIIFGTKSPDYVARKTDLPGKIPDNKLVIDLCVPRNVDPRIGRLSNVHLLNIDQINRTLKSRRKRLTDLLAKAEDIVAESTKKQIEIYRLKEKKKARFLVAG